MHTVQQLFKQTFNRNPKRTAAAPGRVNVIGEHTDYNGGWVMPMPLTLETHVALAPRTDGVVRVVSANAPDAKPTQFELVRLLPEHDWVDYLRGMCAELIKDGHRLQGVDVAITSAVPLGGGLSSSAALEVAFGRAMRDLLGLPLSDEQLAVLGQRCENNFVGAKVGIMDQMASSVGQLGKVLLLNTQTLAYEHIPLPNNMELAVIHSGVHHSHVQGEYNTRRRECEEAAAALGVEALCQLDAQAMSQIETLSEPQRRRARHVVSENLRVFAAAEALRSGDGVTLGKLLAQSHASLRDDYQVSVPAVDALVESALAHPACLGARITGGGFGGCIVVLTQPGKAAQVVRQVLRDCAESAPEASAVLPSLPAETAPRAAAQASA